MVIQFLNIKMVDYKDIGHYGIILNEFSRKKKSLNSVPGVTIARLVIVVNIAKFSVVIGPNLSKLR